MTPSLARLVSPLQSSARAPGPAAKPPVTGVAVLVWGRGGTFGQPDEAPIARTGSESVKEHKFAKPKNAETFTFTEVSRIPHTNVYNAPNGVNVKFPGIQSIIFEGPKRVKGGFEKSSSAGSPNQPKKKNAQLYEFSVFAFSNSPDCWHRIVAVRTHGNV